MKRQCEHCEYLCFPEYESNYSECMVFGDAEPPEEYRTEDGCCCPTEELENIRKANEEAREKDMEAFVDWFLEKENEE